MADTAALKAVAAKIAAQIGVPDAAEDLPDKALSMIASTKPNTRETRNDRRFPNTNQVRRIRSPRPLAFANSARCLSPLSLYSSRKYITIRYTFCRSMLAGTLTMKLLSANGDMVAFPPRGETAQG